MSDIANIVRRANASRTGLQTRELNRQNIRFIEDTLITARHAVSQLESVIEDLQTAQRNCERIAEIQTNSIERQA